MTLDREVAADLHRSAIVIDGLAGSAYQYEPMLEGGLTAAHVTLATSSQRDPLPVLHAALRYQRLAEHVPEKVRMVTSTDHIVASKESTSLGVILGVQGCDCLARDLDNVEILYRHGLRVFQLTYSERNALGWGCFEPNDEGLTYFGRQVVRELNRLGGVVDVAHAGERTALEAISASTGPVVVTHGNPSTLCDNPRNISDELIREIGRSGGVVGISVYSNFVETEHGVWPSLMDVVRHVGFVADLVGVEHVGIGSDMFEGRTRFDFDLAVRRYPDTVRSYTSLETRTVQGLPSLRDLPRLTEALLEGGFSLDDISAVLGGNWLRLFGRVWN